jgi:hypothetical protein
MVRRLVIAALLAGSLFALPGCRRAGGAGFSTVEVSGKVTLQGRPVDRVLLSFTPAEPGKGQPDVCTVEKGVYRTKLIAARYVLALEPANGGTNIPKKYRDPASSGLEFDATQTVEKDWDLP